MAKFFGINKFFMGLQIAKLLGGIRAAMYRLYIMDDLKVGRYIGTDKCGNSYYENNRYYYGRNRWIVYNPEVALEYDATQIPAEWYGWIHYKTDLPPHEDPSRPEYKWMLPHEENPSGSEKQYVPYSTVPQKIHAWRPPKPGEFLDF